MCFVWNFSIIVVSLVTCYLFFVTHMQKAGRVKEELARQVNQHAAAGSDHGDSHLPKVLMEFGRSIKFGLFEVAKF